MKDVESVQSPVIYRLVYRVDAEYIRLFLCLLVIAFAWISWPLGSGR